jgi:hypothetical protein
MNTTVSFDKYLIAPCGINCGTCLAFLRDKNKCSGCGSSHGPRVNHCLTCKIKNCEFLEKTSSKLCYECEKFPCLRLRQIDKRYRTKYRTALIQNLVTIKQIGLDEYLKLESKKWTCSKCGSTLCVHRNKCVVCGNDIN